MKVGILTQWFDPEGGSAVVPGTIARALHRRGFDVEVLTGFPNYPSGRIYPGYHQRLHTREVIDGINVHRVPLYPDHSARTAGRVASYLSFAASSTAGMPLLRDCDALVVYSTPVTVGLGPALARWHSKRPIVTVLQDLWPQTMIHSGLAGGLDRPGWYGIARRASDALYRSSDAIAAIAPGMITALQARGFAPERLHVVYNWVDESLLAVPADRSQWRRRLGLEHAFVAMYAGNLGEPQNAGILVDLAERLREIERIQIVVVGDGVLEAQMRERARTSGLANIHFIGRQPVSEMPNLMAASDVQLITLAASPLFDITIPSKIQFSLAFGRPIAAAVGGDPAALLDASGAARVVAPGDAAALADALIDLAALSGDEREKLGDAGKQYYVEQLSERVGGDALAGLLTSLVQRQSHNQEGQR